MAVVGRDNTQTEQGTSGLLSLGLAASAIGVLQLGVAISLAALIFSGPLSVGAGRASIAFIVSTAIASLAIGLRSKMETAISGTQDTAAIVGAAVAASIAAEASADQAVPTVLTMLAISALLTGAAMWLIGRFELSSIVRSLPYPVVSGFIAGTGWLLFRGGIEVMTRHPVEFESMGEQMNWSTLQLIVPGMILALFMVLCVLREITNVAISIAILAGTILFHVVGRSVADITTLEEDGWLIGPFPEAGGWMPLTPTDLANTDWGVLTDQAGPILAIVAVSVVGILLNLTGLEAVLDSEIDLAHELKYTGGANALIGLNGGLISYHLLGDTTLARTLGVRGRTVPLTIAAMCVAAAVIGPDLVALIPRAIAGGVLVGLGLNVLADWVRRSLPRMNRGDQILSALILAIIAVVGILSGVAAGVVVAALIFVVRYGRTDPVRHIIDSAGTGNVDRPPQVRRSLLAQRNRIVAVDLQGYLFFGSIMKLREKIDTHLDAGDGGPAPTVTTPDGTVDQVDRFVVLDFRRVTGVDSTAASGIAAICQKLSDEGTTIVWSGVDPAIEAELERNGNFFEHAHNDLDHAVAWAEERLVDRTTTAAPLSAPTTAAASFSPEILDLCETRSFESGDILIEVNEADRDLYFVDSGMLSAWIDLPGGGKRRLRRVGPSAVLGEVAFCTGAARTATVVADTDGIVKVLSRGRFDEIVKTDPHTALVLQEFLATRLADRLLSTSSMVRDLSR